jgi:hypothetical protein
MAETLDLDSRDLKTCFGHTENFVEYITYFPSYRIRKVKESTTITKTKTTRTFLPTGSNFLGRYTSLSIVPPSLFFL